MNELIDCLHSVFKVFLSMKEYWFMNSKLQFERHLQFTAVILLQQSHGFVVLIIPCYHAGTIKEANINNQTGNRSFTHCVIQNFSSMHHQCIHQCTINAFINHHQCIHHCIYQCILNAPSIHHQCNHWIKCINFVHSCSSSFHHQCIVSAFINASPMYWSMHHHCNPSMHHQCIFNASIMHHQCFINALSMHSSTHHQCIVSAFINAFSVINIPSMHHHCIKCINFVHSILSFIYQIHSN